jgi:hypothetical protein
MQTYSYAPFSPHISKKGALHEGGVARPLGPPAWKLWLRGGMPGSRDPIEYIQHLFVIERIYTYSVSLQ